MTLSSFAEVRSEDVFRDLAATLCLEADTVTEFSFADSGTSKFNKAIYVSEVDPGILEELAGRACNVAFLADCQGSLVHMCGESLEPRRASNKTILKKSIISFDVDFKDMPTRAKHSQSGYEIVLMVTAELVKKAGQHCIPIWLVTCTGNGLHIYFKLQDPLKPGSPAEYQDQYRQWVALFCLLFGSDVVFDISCGYLARPMRLPLSTNWKDKNRPLPNKVLFHDPQADASVFFRRLSSPFVIAKRHRYSDKLTLASILKYFGYQKTETIKIVDEQMVCSSPFGVDDAASFHCHQGMKVFYDFSKGIGGSFYQLISELSGERTTKGIEALIRKILGEGRAQEELGRYSLREDGVWFSKPVADDEESTWICSPLVIEAMTRDQGNGAWGRVLGFYDQDQRYKKWAMPMELVAGDGLELRKELLARGLRISPSHKARRHLLEYIESCSPSERARCIDRIGWQGSSYVLPDNVFLPAANGEAVVLQKQGDFSVFQTRGTLAEWQEHIAMLCRGNSRLVFALAVAFAPPLLQLVGEESGGIHLTGPSSIGKTMALRVAGSVWGGGGVNGFVRKWRSTVNALESLAESRCDSLLVLDEIAEISPKDAAQATYMLANGCGKKRLDRNGIPKPSAEWRVLFLSSGEVGLGGHLAEAGETHRGGQFVRLVEIEADAGKGLGIFDTIGSFSDPQALADELRASCVNFYGTPIHAYLEKLVTMGGREAAINEITRGWFASESTSGLSGQLMRVAKRFALIAAGGVLAVRFGILPLEESEVLESVQECFKSWARLHSDHPDFETARILSQIRQYLQANGCSQFPEWDGRATATFAGKCSGYRLVTSSGDVEWLVLNEVFRNDVCRGLDFRKATQVLKGLGLVKVDRNGKTSVPMRLPHFGATRVYHLRSNILEDSASE